MTQFENCILCGSEITPVSGYEKHKLVKCSSCKFVFCKPKPSAEELINHYKSYGRAKGISQITIKRYNELLDSFEKYRKTNNIIDVGCGDGYFLAEAAKRGWKVFGTEFTEEAIRVCEMKNISMKMGSIKAEMYPADFFDIITSFEVIEHINNPIEETHIYKTILRPGGIVYLTTPNFNSVSRLVLGAKWNVIEYPEHLCYYTRGTLKKLFSRIGFASREARTTGVSFSRFYGSTHTDLAPAFSDEALRKKTETNFVFRVFKWAVNFLLNLSGRGDSLKAIFIKT